MSMFRLNKVYWIEILIFRFKNNILEFKYELDQLIFLNLNNNFRNWNVNFQIQITIFNIEKVHFKSHLIIFNLEVLILGIQNNNLELKFQVKIKWLFKI
jgi:hypothetical protein